MKKEQPTWAESSIAHYYTHGGFAHLGISATVFTGIFTVGEYRTVAKGFLYDYKAVPLSVYKQFSANQDGYGPIPANDDQSNAA